MAKGITPASTRLAATVNARYYPVEGVADAYCLDGRLPGKRELRSVNTTLDRESRGFLISVFGYPIDGRGTADAWSRSLKQLSEQISSGAVDIDGGINDLAEAAIEVTGRLEVHRDAVREPYFAGIIIRDGEMAALTVGSGVALIYRHDVLYPLTGSVHDLKASDLYGDPVEGIDDFIAGDAGTISYSNIAQLEEGDRFILCNDDLFRAVGQEGLMRILDESEDQIDASGEMMTVAAANMPGKPLQVIALSVDKIQVEETTSRFSLGRFATQAMEPVRESHTAKHEPAARVQGPDLSATQRYQKQDMMDLIPPQKAENASARSDFSRPAAGEERPVPPPVSSGERYRAGSTGLEVSPMISAGRPENRSAYDERRTRDPQPAFPEEDYSEDGGVSDHEPELPPAGFEKGSVPGSIPVSALNRAYDAHEPLDDFSDDVTDADYLAQPVGPEEDRGRLPEFAYSSAQQRRRTARHPYREERAAEDESWSGRDRDPRFAAPAPTENSRYYDDYDPYQEEFDNDETGTHDYRRPAHASNRTRRIIFYAVLIAIIIICIIALISLLTKKESNTPGTSQPSASEAVIPPASEKSTEPDPSESVTEPSGPSEQPSSAPSESASPGSANVISHTVVAGDTWWGICMKYYNTASEGLCQRLAEANGKKMTDNIHVGQIIKVPPLNELIGKRD